MERKEMGKTKNTKKSSLRAKRGSPEKKLNNWIAAAASGLAMTKAT